MDPSPTQPPDRPRLRVLIIDDDEDDYIITRTLLGKAVSIRCETTWASTYEDGIREALEHPYDACLVDYRLGARTGLDVLQAVKDAGRSLPMILLTGQGDLEVDLSAMSAGAADYLTKERLAPHLLERSIRYALERHHADNQIRAQAALLDKAQDAIIAHTLDGTVTYWNKSAERLTGWTAAEMMGHNLYERAYQADAPRLDEARRRVEIDGEWVGELHQPTRSGEDKVVESRWTLVRDDRGAPSTILIINTDITERKQLETQFLRVQRMDSIGRLVGGIAHDLGNLLVPILLGTEVLRKRLDHDDRAQRSLDMIQKSAQRGADMVKHVLAFARGVEGERVHLPLSSVVSEVERILRETLPPTLTLETHLAEDLWPIEGDPTQIQQVLMNLCVNARDAMEGRGHLCIKAENRTIDESYARYDLEAKTGHYVRLSVRDTGPGIANEIQDKVFEPFFTTKPTGKGTGLGLSTVYSIVQSHGGFVSLLSEMGTGTRFDIYLPAVLARHTAPAPEGPSTELTGHGELILVIDDEAYIRDAARLSLEEAGYRVATASNGQEALAFYEAHHAEVDAVLTDLMMPEMDGGSTIEALRKRDRRLPIIATSGMAGTDAHKALKLGANLFVAKPYSVEQLREALGELLASTTA